MKTKKNAEDVDEHKPFIEDIEKEMNKARMELIRSK